MYVVCMVAMIVGTRGDSSAAVRDYLCLLVCQLREMALSLLLWYPPLTVNCCLYILTRCSAKWREPNQLHFSQHLYIFFGWKEELEIN